MHSVTFCCGRMFNASEPSEMNTLNSVCGHFLGCICPPASLLHAAAALLRFSFSSMLPLALFSLIGPCCSQSGRCPLLWDAQKITRSLKSWSSGPCLPPDNCFNFLEIHTHAVMSLWNQRHLTRSISPDRTRDKQINKWDRDMSSLLLLPLSANRSCVSRCFTITPWLTDWLTGGMQQSIRATVCCHDLYSKRTTPPHCTLFNMKGFCPSVSLLSFREITGLKWSQNFKTCLYPLLFNSVDKCYTNTQIVLHAWWIPLVKGSDRKSRLSSAARAVEVRSRWTTFSVLFKKEQVWTSTWALVVLPTSSPLKHSSREQEHQFTAPASIVHFQCPVLYYSVCV